MIKTDQRDKRFFLLRYFDLKYGYIIVVIILILRTGTLEAHENYWKIVVFILLNNWYNLQVGQETV